MANKLEQILKSIDSAKLESLKKKTENAEFSELLKSVDKDKAKKMLDDLGLAETTKNINFEKIINEARNNPDILKEIKKIF